MSKKSGDPQLAGISRKLDVLVRLVALNLVQGVEIQKDQISTLHFAGFKPKQIAEILGTTSNTVSVALSGMRKGKQKEAVEEPAQTDTVQEDGIAHM